MTQDEVDARILQHELKRNTALAKAAHRMVTYHSPIPGGDTLMEELLGMELAIAVVRYEAQELDLSAMTVEHLKVGDRVRPSQHFLDPDRTPGTVTAVAYNNPRYVFVHWDGEAKPDRYSVVDAMLERIEAAP